MMYKYLFFIIIIIFYNCNNYNNSKVSFDDQVIVKIDDQIILKNEFIQRAEYVLRPQYCIGNSSIHKQIILNSLIAEKLLAKEGRSIFNINQVVNILKGLKNQSMREKLYFTKLKNYDFKNNELDNYINSAGRTYSISFISLIGNTRSDSLEDIFNSKTSLNSLFDSKDVAKREISFFQESNYILNKALFSKIYKKGDIIGPLILDDGSLVAFRIESWKSKKRLSKFSQVKYLDDIKEHLSNMYNKKEYSEFIHSIMLNKKIQFNKDVFSKLIKHLYLEMERKDKSREQLFKKAIWPESKLVLDAEYDMLDFNKNDIIFTLDNEKWTMSRLNDLIKSHRLVFRKKKISKKEFPEAVKNAIADLIRDYFITKEAYNKGYENDIYINQYIDMWRDHFRAQFMRKKILKSIGESSNDIDILNPIIAELFEKYSSKIFINFELFDSINLTSTQMYVKNQNAAYQSPIPQFPILTDKYKINYGKIK